MKFLSLLLLCIISFRSALAQDRHLTVVSSINPIHQIVLAITQNKNNSILIINPNISEHDYQFKPGDIEAVSKADLIFYVDKNLEKNFAKLAKNKNAFQLSEVPGLKVLHGRKNPKKLDLHLWLNPQNAVKIAEFVSQKLCEKDAAGCEQYQKNFEKFKKDEAKNSELNRQKLAVAKGESYVFYYDAYQYFEDYFALNSLRIVVSDHDHGLTIRDLREFHALAEEVEIKCLFGDKFDEKNSAQKLTKNYRIKLVALDPIGGEGGYFKMISDLVDVVSSCLK